VSDVPRETRALDRPRAWIVVAGVVIAAVLVVAIVIFAGHRVGAPSASQTSAKLNHQMEVAMSTTGGSWTDYTRSRPWTPSTAKTLVITSCSSNRNQKQYLEIANGPGFPQPDATASKLAGRWKSEGYSTELIGGLGANASEKDGFHLVFSTSKIISQLLARSSCF
jgi:hypothetical protein